MLLAQFSFYWAGHVYIPVHLPKQRDGSCESYAAQEQVFWIWPCMCSSSCYGQCQVSAFSLCLSPVVSKGLLNVQLQRFWHASSVTGLLKLGTFWTALCSVRASIWRTPGIMKYYFWKCNRNIPAWMSPASAALLQAAETVSNWAFVSRIVQTLNVSRVHNYTLEPSHLCGKSPPKPLFRL